MRNPRRLFLLPVLSMGVLVAGCGDDADTGESAEGTVTVFAASSLTDAFTELGEAFHEQRPDTEVELSFAASSELVTQINEGADADVFASADQNNMTKLVDGEGTVATPQGFATNRLQIIVEPGNPEGIDEVADLADPGLIFVTAAPEVPIGKYTQEVFTKAGVTVTPKSLEENVKGIVSKVTLGEADAGIVYRTDVLAAGDKADGVDIPADLNVVASYPIAVPSSSDTPDAAAAFVEFVLSPEGQAILTTYGFSGP